MQLGVFYRMRSGSMPSSQVFPGLGATPLGCVELLVLCCSVLFGLPTCTSLLGISTKQHMGYAQSAALALKNAGLPLGSSEKDRISEVIPSFARASADS